MECSGKRYIAHSSRTDVFTLWNVSDMHLLNKACHLKQLRQEIKQIGKDRFSFWIGGGDMWEAITPDDKRFDPRCVSGFVSIEDLSALGKLGMRVVEHELRPIAPKCLGLLLGNHELKYMRRKDQGDWHTDLCQWLGTHNLGYTTVFDVVFIRVAGRKPPRLLSASEANSPPYSNKSHRESFRIIATHGAGAAQTAGGRITRVVKYMHAFPYAHIYFMGHVHDKTGQRLDGLDGDEACTSLVARPRIGVVAGGYLRTYAENCIGYGEEKGYSPTTPGAAWVKIRPATRKYWGEI